MSQVIQFSIINIDDPEQVNALVITESCDLETEVSEVLQDQHGGKLGEMDQLSSGNYKVRWIESADIELEFYCVKITEHNSYQSWAVKHGAAA